MSGDDRCLDVDSSSSDPPRRMGSAEKQLRSLALNGGHTTLHSLARAAGVDRHTIGLAMRGETEPRRAVVARLAVALRVDAHLLDRLFALAREEHPRTEPAA